MLQSYFKIAVRNLRRNGRYFAINVLGLGIALGFCILAFTTYQYVQRYDQWHRDAVRIVRVELLRSSNKELYGIAPAPLGAVAAMAFKEVASTCRFDARQAVVKCGEEVFNERISYADDNFFQFFDFELVKGSPSLYDHSKILLDETTAERYFGQTDPVGQQLILYADTDYRLTLTVCGVVKTIPLNSSLQFGLITHLDNYFDGGRRKTFTDWESSVDALFLKMNNIGELQALSAGIQQYVAPFNSACPERPIDSYRLQPLPGMAAGEAELRANALWLTPPPTVIGGVTTIAILLLLTAALNFANMTIAICNRRLREMAVRKVMGGTRFQIGRQMLAESFVVVMAGTGMAMILAYPIVEWFNSTWDFLRLTVDFRDPAMILYLCGAGLATTLLGGIYPAFYISSLKPSGIFRGNILFGGSNLFSRIMMGMQIAISVMAIVVGVSFAYNAEFNRTADIGFDYQPIIQAWLPNPGDYRIFNNAVKNIPGVIETAPSLHLPGFGFNITEFSLDGKTEESNIYEVGNNFTQIMRFRLIEGALPAPAGDTVASAEILVNQTFIRKNSGDRSLVGEQISIKNKPYRIAGVVADFLTNTPFEEIQPAILHQIPESDCRRCLVRTAAMAQQPAVMAAIEKQWKNLFPYTPFNAGYQQEMMRGAIHASESIASNMFFLSIITILLSVTGLFSLVSLNVLRRVREIAIRRVMGAGSWHITWILNRQYVFIFSGAVIVGCLLGRAMSNLLMDNIFKFSAGVNPVAMLYSGLGMLLIAAVTIGLKIWQTLRENPADVLRGE